MTHRIIDDQVVITCDICGSHSQPADTPNQALELARQEGFYVIVTPSLNFHACSRECRLEITAEFAAAKKPYQIMLPYWIKEYEPDEPTTYTQEFDEYTDADPGL